MPSAVITIEDGSGTDATVTSKLCGLPSASL